jgi:hypothetical protein
VAIHIETDVSQLQRFAHLDWHDAALILAGVIGTCVAVVHGVLVQRLMVGPLGRVTFPDRRSAATIKRLAPMLLHFSTICWFLGGLVLMAAAIWFEPQVRFTTALFVGCFFLYGAVGNFWGTRGRHPGWMLMTVAVMLIAAGVWPK